MHVHPSVKATTFVCLEVEEMVVSQICFKICHKNSPSLSTPTANDNTVLNSTLCRHEREHIQPQITWALRTQKHSLEPNQFILVSSRTVEETSSHEINI